MKLILILFLFAGINVSLFAKDNMSSKQEAFITQLLEQQVKQQNSIKSSISSILTRYPEKVDVVVRAALKLYPDEYVQIMHGALAAEPVLTCNVVQLFVEADVAPLSEIVNLAIQAEPAYIQEIMKTASITYSHEKPNHEIYAHNINVNALMSETMITYPKSKIDILKGTIAAFPEKVVNFVKEALLLFPGEDKQIISTAVNASDEKYTQSIIDTAMSLGVKQEIIDEAAQTKGR